MVESIHLLVFTIDSRRLGLRPDAVDRAVRACEVTTLPGAPDAVLGVVNLAGEVVPVLDMRRRLRLPPRSIDVDHQLLIVHAGHRRYGIVADEIDEVRAFPADQVVEAGELAEGTARIGGVVRLPDGLLMIEDPDRFLDIEALRTLARALRPGGDGED